VIACFEAQTQFQVKQKHKHHWEKDKIMFNLQNRFTTTSHQTKTELKQLTRVALTPPPTSAARSRNL
jgi:hypothetical protein